MLPHPTLDKLQSLRLHGMLKALAEQLKIPDIGSLSFEMSDVLPAIGAEVERIQQASVDILRDCLEQARAAGELGVDEDCDNLATFIANAWQGVLARLKVGRSLQPLEAFIQRLELLLQP